MLRRMHSFRFISAAALVAALLTPLGASAQTLPPAAAPVQHRHHAGRFATAVHALNLSADQRRQIDDAIASNRATSRGADKATKQANRKRLRAQIESLLTPDQRAQLSAELHRKR